MGKDLTGLGLKELQNLEQQLNEGLLSVKARKVSLIPLPLHYVPFFSFSLRVTNKKILVVVYMN